MFACVVRAVHVPTLVVLALLATSPAVAAPLLAVGTDAGSDVPVPSRVNIYSDTNRDGDFETNLQSLVPFGTFFTGGASVALGDMNGDFSPEVIMGTGAGLPTIIRAMTVSSLNELYNFSPYPSFIGGVTVAAGDVNDDGLDDIITGTGPGPGLGPNVKAFSGANGDVLNNFFAFSPGFTGGVNVAAGLVDGDNAADIITGAGPGGQPQVNVFDPVDTELLDSFFAYDTAFTGGVSVAAGDVNNDGVADIITGSGPGATGHVKVFSGADGSEIRSFFAFDTGFQGGVRVASADVNNDGFDDLFVGTGPGGGLVRVYDGETLELLDSLAPLRRVLHRRCLRSRLRARACLTAPALSRPACGPSPPLSRYRVAAVRTRCTASCGKAPSRSRAVGTPRDKPQFSRVRPIP